MRQSAGDRSAWRCQPSRAVPLFPSSRRQRTRVGLTRCIVKQCVAPDIQFCQRMQSLLLDTHQRPRSLVVDFSFEYGKLSIAANAAILRIADRNFAHRRADVHGPARDCALQCRARQGFFSRMGQCEGRRSEQEREELTLHRQIRTRLLQFRAHKPKSASESPFALRCSMSGNVFKLWRTAVGCIFAAIQVAVRPGDVPVRDARGGDEGLAPRRSPGQMVRPRISWTTRQRTGLSCPR